MIKKLLPGVLFCMIVVKFSTAAPEPCDNFFKKFAIEANSDHVKYFSKNNKLVFCAKPNVTNDKVEGVLSVGVGSFAAIFWLICFMACVSDEPLDPSLVIHNHTTGVPIYYRGTTNKENALLFGFLGSAFSAATIALIVDIIKNYKLRNSFTPYLTFDDNGLKKFDTYVLKWQDIENIEHETIINRGLTFKSLIYTDKFGSVLFNLSSMDLLLPVEFEKAQSVFRYCLSCYGKEKFRSKL